MLISPAQGNRKEPIRTGNRLPRWLKRGGVTTLGAGPPGGAGMAVVRWAPMELCFWRITPTSSAQATRAAMGMSYKHAWLLVEDINRLCGKPVVVAKKGGQRGGGSELTPVGLSIVARYRAI